jgi:pyruvate dehydrogenase (quinone)
MAQNVADLMWKMLEKAGVKRCYGIIRDALNPVLDALRRNGNIDFVQVRHEEYGVFGKSALLLSCDYQTPTGVPGLETRESRGTRRPLKEDVCQTRK